MSVLLLSTCTQLILYLELSKEPESNIFRPLQQLVFPHHFFHPLLSEWWSHMLHSINCLHCSLWSLTWTLHPAKAAPCGVLTISQHFVAARTHNTCARCETPIYQAVHHVWTFRLQTTLRLELWRTDSMCNALTVRCTFGMVLYCLLALKCLVTNLNHCHYNWRSSKAIIYNKQPAELLIFSHNFQNMSNDHV